MGMRQRIARSVGNGMAPKAKLSRLGALDRNRTALGKAASRAIHRISPARRRRSRARALVTGVGAAAMAVPVGLWLGRRYREAHRQQPIAALDWEEGASYQLSVG